MSTALPPPPTSNQQAQVEEPVEEGLFGSFDCVDLGAEAKKPAAPVEGATDTTNNPNWRSRRDQRKHAGHVDRPKWYARKQRGAITRAQKVASKVLWCVRLSADARGCDA